MSNIIDGRFEPHRIERLSRRGPAQFRALPQGEEGLLAAGRLTRLRRRQDLLDAHVGLIHGGRGASKRTIMTNVAAQMGERKKYLSRIGDDPRHPPSSRPVIRSPE